MATSSIISSHSAEAVPSPVNTTMTEVVGPLSPASTPQSGQIALSPQSTRSAHSTREGGGASDVAIKAEEEDSLADFSCALFSPKKCGSGIGEVVVDEQMNVLSSDQNEQMPPGSFCSCRDDNEASEAPAAPAAQNSFASAGEIGDPAKEMRASPVHSAMSILADSEDESYVDEAEEMGGDSHEDSDGTVSSSHDTKRKNKLGVYLETGDKKAKKDKKKQKKDKEKKKKDKKKSTKTVAFLEKNPTPLSPPMSPMSDYTSCSSYQGGQSTSMLSPRNDDEETLTLEDNVEPDWIATDSEDENGSRKESLLSRAKNRNLSDIQREPKRTPSSNRTRDHTEVIPDDESEASLMVLMRYMGCTPVAYGKGSVRPIGTPTGREFVFDSFDDDDNSLLSDEEYDDNSTYVSQDIQTSWTMQNDEVGIEMELDEQLLQGPPKVAELETKKKKNKNLTVDTKPEKKKKKKGKKKKKDEKKRKIWEEEVAASCSMGSPRSLGSAVARSPGSIAGPGSSNIASPRSIASPGSISIASPGSIVSSANSFKSPATPNSIFTSPGTAVASSGSGSVTGSPVTSPRSAVAASPVGNPRCIESPDALLKSLQNTRTPDSLMDQLKRLKSPDVAGAEDVLSDDELNDFLEGKEVVTFKKKKKKKKKKAVSTTTEKDIAIAKAKAASLKEFMDGKEGITTKKKEMGASSATTEEDVEIAKARAARAIDAAAEARAGTPRSTKATSAMSKSFDFKAITLPQSSDKNNDTSPQSSPEKPDKNATSGTKEEVAIAKARAARAIDAAAEARAGTPRSTKVVAVTLPQTSKMKAVTPPMSSPEKSDGTTTNKNEKKVAAPLAGTEETEPSSLSDIKVAASSETKESKKSASSDAKLSSTDTDSSLQSENSSLKESLSTRSDKENGSALQSKATTTANKKSLMIETGASSVPLGSVGEAPLLGGPLTPGTTKSVQEVDELLAKTREWLVRHNESRPSKNNLLPANTTTPGDAANSKLTINTSTPSVERKVMGNITARTVLGNTTPPSSSPRTLAEQMLQSKGISISAGARAKTAPLLSSSTTTNNAEPKKSILEQLGEIRAKQREIELRHKKKSSTDKDCEGASVTESHV